MAKQRVKFIFPYQDASPPVYLCGTFTDPAWVPNEMKAVHHYTHVEDRNDPGLQYIFEYTVDLEQGHWEYKFRVGEERWVCDDDAPKVTSEQGFVNNVLVVGSAEKEEKTALDANCSRQPASAHSISWELMKKNVSGENLFLGNQSFTSLTSHLDAEAFEEQDNDIAFVGPLEHLNLAESQSPNISFYSNPTLPQQKFASSNELTSFTHGHCPSSADIRSSFESGESFGRGSEASGNRRSRSVPDIERITYLMAMPRGDGSSEPADIMAYQDSQILQLSPDYTTSKRLPTDGVNPSGAPLLSHAMFPSEASTPVHTPARQRGSTVSSLQQSESLQDSPLAVAPKASPEDPHDLNVDNIPEDRRTLAERLRDLIDQSILDQTREIETEAAAVESPADTVPVKSGSRIYHAFEAEAKTEGSASYVGGKTATKGVNSPIEEKEENAKGPEATGDGTTDDGLEHEATSMRPQYDEDSNDSLAVDKARHQRLRDATSQQRAGSKRTYSATVPPFGSARSDQPLQKRRRGDGSVVAAVSTTPLSEDEGFVQAAQQDNGFELPWYKRVWVWVKLMWERVTGKEKHA